MTLDAQRRQELINRFACRIQGLGWTVPAVLFLEMHKPLAFVGAQFVLAAQPFLTLEFKDADVRDMAALLEDRASVQALIERLTTDTRS